MTRVGVVVGYRPGNDAARSASYGLVKQHYAAWNKARVATINPPSQMYSRALAFNIGARQATCDVLVLSNSDVIVSHDALDDAVSIAARHRGTVYPFTDYVELTKACSEEWVKGRWCMDVEYQQADSVGPVLVVQRSHYLEVGGMDPRFRGWGFEDVAWATVSATLLGAHKRVAGPVIHLWHEAMKESAHYTPPIYYTNMALCDRYLAASGDAAKIRALQREHTREEHDDG